MEHGEILFTIAEVAVAFAGFASIVGILGRRSTSSPDDLVALRMRIMLLHSLTVVAFSFVPHLIHTYGIEGEVVWRASSGFWLIVSGFVGVSIAVRVRALISASDYRDRTGIVALGVFIADTGLSLANVLGLTEQIAAAVYLTALALRLFLSGLAFSSVISSFLTPSEPGS